jgi:hypothetical protein
MAITRINHSESNTVGWQARAHVAPGHRLTRFFADQSHGGMAKAYDLAVAAERQLKRRARALSNAVGGR